MSTNRRLALAIKRLMDIVLSAIVLLLTALPMLVIALAVKLTSPGPIFFVQERVGKDKRLFNVVKFRTMRDKMSDESHHRWTANDEERVTSIGYFLRDYGLDELPQTLSIIRGDMSIIGPRPILPSQIDGLSERETLMFQMRPGVLSLAAIRGRRGLSLKQRYEYHVQYVEQWSLRLDITILFKSLLIVLRREKARDTVPGTDMKS